MGDRKLNFLHTVATEYSEKCPELSRIMMMKYFERLEKPNIEGYDREIVEACEHCGTVFTGSNCKFRVKPKRKRKKKRCVRLQDDNKAPKSLDIMPKSSNFLQIHCHYCGWKTRRIGAMRKTRGSTRDIDGSFGNTNETQGDTSSQTPKLSRKCKQTVTPKMSTAVHKGSLTTPKTPQMSPGIRKESGKHSSTGSRSRKKTKSRLKELLAQEKLESEQKISSPSLINFLSNI